MALNFISEQMNILAVPYELGEWTSDVQYPYFVGEITEDEPTTEDGAESATLLLTGFNRGEYSALENIKKKIKKHFPAADGLRGQTEDGAIVVMYAGALQIPTGEADLKRIEIRLKIKQWKGEI